MKYEIVTLQERKAVGVSGRTESSAPDAGAVIGGLWQKFFNEGVYSSIEHKANEKALGLYTDYTGDDKSGYTAIAACEVEQVQGQPEGLCVCTIPAGRYAKFIVKGHMVQAVAAFWSALGELDLPRSFVCDFEEYQDGRMEDAEIHIYVGLKE